MQITKIIEIVSETEKIKTIKTEMKAWASPGQFVMLWVPGVDEKPFSLSYLSGNIGVTVLMKGPFTKHLGKMRKGDVIGIRGPIGNGFKIKGDRLLLVGGGIGTAPIAPLAEYANNQGKKVTVVVGATTKNELLFIDRIKKTGAKIFITTNDGSMGKKGNTTDITKKLMEEKSFDQCFACGPEIMMAKLLNQARNAGIPIQLSIERYFKCGIGICGHCAIDPGLRVCTEGPVFKGDELGYEFGRYHRDASGRKIIFKEV